MAQYLPEGATILPADLTRILNAQRDLAATTNAKSSVDVKIYLRIHREYPKHVMLGSDSVVVNNAIEESNVAAGRKPNHRHAPLPTNAQIDSLNQRFNPKAPVVTKPVFETKNYTDGSSATGVAPLPNQSPEQQDAARRNQLL
jgi:hypothetical protein